MHRRPPPSTKLLTLFLSSFLMLSSVARVDASQCINNTGEIIIREGACPENEHSANNNKLSLRQRAENLYKAAMLKLDKYLSSASRIESPVTENPIVKSKNLLKNAAFENQLTAWQVPQDALWAADKGILESGALTLHARLPPDNKYIYETTVRQCVIVEADNKYQLSAQFVSTKPPLKAHANRANVIWYESTDCTSGGQWGAYIEPKAQESGWQQLSRNNLLPALGAQAAMITIVQNGRYSEGGEAVWDNIYFGATQNARQLKKMTNSEASDEFTLALGVNYASNGEFDNNTTAWHAAQETEWSESQGDRSPGSVKITLLSRSGSLGRGVLRQCINFGEHSVFEVGASYKKDDSSTQTGGARLRLVWYKNLNCRGAAKTDPNWADSDLFSDWQQLHIVGLSPPSNAQSAKIDIIQSISAAGEFSLYWDNIYFIATH